MDRPISSTKIRRSQFATTVGGLFFVWAGLFLSNCETPRCNDGVWNGDETSIDCGGSCEPCYSCSDGYKNQGESEVDCGGPCKPCAGEWQVLNTLATNGSLQHVHFFTPQSGIVAAPDAFYLTADGGNTWQTVPMPSVAGGPVRKIRKFKFLNAQFGYALLNLSESADQAAAIITRDGGRNWTVVQVPNWPSGLPLGYLGMDFADPNNGLLITQEQPNMTWWGYGPSFAYRTIDGGLTWTFVHNFYQEVPNAEILLNVYYPNVLRAYAHNGYNNWVKSVDLGATWFNMPNIPNPYNLWTFGKDTLLSLTGGGSIQQSNDAGIFWTIVNPYLNNDQVPEFEDLQTAYATYQYITPNSDGSPGQENRYVVLQKSNDKTLSWQPVGFFYSQINLAYQYKLNDYARADNTYYVVGEKGLLLKLVL